MPWWRCTMALSVCTWSFGNSGEKTTLGRLPLRVSINNVINAIIEPFIVYVKILVKYILNSPSFSICIYSRRQVMQQQTKHAPRSQIPAKALRSETAMRATVRVGSSERARTPQHLGVEQVHFDPREERRVLMCFIAKERFLEPVGFPSLPGRHQQSHYGTGHGHARSGATRSDRATCSFLYCRAQQRIRDSAPLREKSLKSLAGSLVMTFFLAADCCTAAEEHARVRARAPRGRAMPMRSRGGAHKALDGTRIQSKESAI